MESPYALIILRNNMAPQHAHLFSVIESTFFFLVLKGATRPTPLQRSLAILQHWEMLQAAKSVVTQNTDLIARS